MSAEFGGWLSGIMFNLFGIEVGHEVYQALKGNVDLTAHLPANTLTANEKAKLEQWQRETAQTGQIRLNTDMMTIWQKISASVAANGFIMGQPKAAITGLANVQSFMYQNGYNIAGLDTLFQVALNNPNYYGTELTIAYYMTSETSMLIFVYSTERYPHTYWNDEGGSLRRLWCEEISRPVDRGVFNTFDKTYTGVWTPIGTTSTGSPALYVPAWNDIRGQLGATQAETEIPNVNTQTQADAAAGELAIVTPYTDITGPYDPTADIVIPIPQTLPTPAPTVADIPAVIATLPAVVTDTDDTDIPEIAADLAADYPAAGEYNLGLTNFFPFCIPFDIYDILTSFVHEPVAPSITIDMPIGYDPEEGVITQSFTIDLSQFDSVAEVLRMLEMVLFGVGLGVATRQKYLRG